MNDTLGLYSRTSIIQTPMVPLLNVKGVQISEFIWISELSDKIHYLASYVAIYNNVFTHNG